jgi:hypothetical protein
MSTPYFTNSGSRRVRRSTSDPPPVVGARELFFDPLQLRLVHVVAVQREEACVALLERVEAFAIHVERLVEALCRVVVVAQ